MLEKRLECPHCRTREGEWKKDRRAYYPEVFTCRGCSESGKELESAMRGYGKQTAHGLYVRLVPKEEHLRQVAERKRQREKESRP